MSSTFCFWLFKEKFVTLPPRHNTAKLRQSHLTEPINTKSKMDIKKALFISQEISPYLPSTPHRDTGRDVAQHIMTSGVEVRTFMPKYGMINERRNQLHEVIRLSGLNIVIDDSDHPLVIKVATLQPSRMQVYFIDNEDYFGNGEPGRMETESLMADNDERIIFFVRGVFETIKKLRWVPQLVQCSGWVTALAPMYMRHMYGDDPTIRDAKIVYVMQNDRFDGTLDGRFVEKLRLDGLSDDALAPLGESPVDYRTLSRLAIDHADAIVQAVADVDDELVAYAKASGKPFAAFDGSEDPSGEAYLTFYRSI